MKNSLLMLILFTMLGSSLFVGGGTYAILTASTARSQNEFSTFQPENIDIRSTPTAPTSAGMRSIMIRVSMAQPRQIAFPMFYDTDSYPVGQNPYDVTKGAPSGEIPGGWEPGDSVTRYWVVNNIGSSAKVTNISATLDSLTGPKGKILPGTRTYEDFLQHMSVKVYSNTDDMNPVFNGTFQQLVSGCQPLKTIMYLSRGCYGYKLRFVVSMDKSAGNDLQSVKGVLDFKLSAAQCRNNWFDPDDNDDGDGWGGRDGG